jgi:hypothetical protein
LVSLRTGHFFGMFLPRAGAALPFSISITAERFPRTEPNQPPLRLRAPPPGNDRPTFDTYLTSGLSAYGCKTKLVPLGGGG